MKRPDGSPHYEPVAKLGNDITSCTECGVMVEYQFVNTHNTYHFELEELRDTILALRSHRGDAGHNHRYPYSHDSPPEEIAEAGRLASAVRR